MSDTALQTDLATLNVLTDPVVRKLMRAFSRAKTSNPIINPVLVSGAGAVTMTLGTTASTTATQKHLVAGDLFSMANTGGGVPTIWGSNKAAFPCISVAPSTTGGNLSTVTSAAIPAFNSWAWFIETVTEDLEVEFAILGNSTLGFRVSVDGQYINSTEPTMCTTTGLMYINLGFPARATRVIRAEFQTAICIYWIACRPTSNLRKNVTPDQILHIAVGDSYSEGQGATLVGIQSHQIYLGKRLGVNETRLLALGSTGIISSRFLPGTATTTAGSATANVVTFTGTSSLSVGQLWTGAGNFPVGTTIAATTGGTGAVTLSQNATSTNASAAAFTANGSMPLEQQINTWFSINTDITGAQVGLITILHGYNDYSYTEASTVSASLTAAMAANYPYAATGNIITPAVTRALTKMRLLCPNAVILFYSSQPGLRNNDANTLLIEAQVAAGVTAMNDPKIAFIPVSGAVPPLNFGTGYTGATNGSGNTDFMIASDGVHWTTLGHWHGAQYEAMMAYEAVRAMAYGG